jgi:putative ABC transport system permease protein
MFALLSTFSWQELRHHPWRNAAAMVAVMLGVALAFSVHLINASALDEFSSAVRSVNGQPDLELRAVQGNFDESIFARVVRDSRVTLASPVLEINTEAIGEAQPGVAAKAVPIRVVGVDALALPSIAPALMPRPSNTTRFSLFAPNQIFLNAAARSALGSGESVQLKDGSALHRVEVAGSVAASGTPLAVMDIGAAQDLFGRGGQLTRIDLRLAQGTDHATFIRSLRQSPDWPAAIQIAEPGDAVERISNLSRAYRVNLTVLALVALFTGAFLVFSVLALSVAKRAQQFALLGVLGLTPRQRLQLVLAESLVLGVIGSAAGIALGTALAAFALKVLGGDLGGGYFAGVAPALRWSMGGASIYGGLGVLAAMVGGWYPARAAQALPEAQTLKGLGAAPAGSGRHWVAASLIVIGAALAYAPPLFGMPIAAYVSVGLLLVGGITALPGLIALLYDSVAPLLAQRLLPMLAVERARRMRGTAAVAVSGVVASLSLAVALTVMVASFRDSVTHWLDVVLPADLYLRAASATGGAGGAGGSGATEAGPFTPSLVQAIAQLPEIVRVGTVRARPVSLDPSQPSVMLLARSFGDDNAAARSLPLVGDALAVPAGQIGIYVSEAMVDLYGARPGTAFKLLTGAFAKPTSPSVSAPVFFVAGVWRDYVRQFGSVVLDARDFERLTDDRSVNDISLWLKPGASESKVQDAIRALVGKQTQSANDGVDMPAPAALEFSSVSQLRATSLRIFDRSFAVTYWLQGVAIAIGLFGIAASFSAQVLARRKEFGLLAHLGFTQRQVLAVVAGEGAAWTAIGAVAGLALGLAVSVVLVHVVNPQSFHWTMDLLVPWLRLLALCASVVAAGTVTAWLAGRSAAGQEAVLAVKEDW